MRRRARSSRAFRFPGASPKAMTTSAAITWCGRATSSRRRAGSSPPARARGEVGARLSGGDPGGRRPLVAELLARRHGLLGRHPDRRNRVSDPALRHAAARRRDRRPRHRGLRGDDPDAAGYIVRNGPATSRIAGKRRRLFAFTIAVEIPALLAAADAMEAAARAERAPISRETADGWNEQIEDWAYAGIPRFRAELGVDGYYMRIGSSRRPMRSVARADLRSRTGPTANAASRQAHLISPDALALVRFGLRAADDPRISIRSRRSTRCSRRDLPPGPYWYRYNEDGYGEHADGAPFDGAGIGRLWPLLTGERAHYELAAGRPSEAQTTARSAGGPASTGGLMPEQIWDSEDIPEREFSSAGPSGSAMPLVWAHAEHVKLLRSLRDGAVFDMPPQTLNRYVRNKPPPAPIVWRVTSKVAAIAAGRILRLEFLEAARSIGRRIIGTRFPTATRSRPVWARYLRSADRALTCGDRSLHHLLAEAKPLGRR